MVIRGNKGLPFGHEKIRKTEPRMWGVSDHPLPRSPHCKNIPKPTLPPIKYSIVVFNWAAHRYHFRRLVMLLLDAEIRLPEKATVRKTDRTFVHCHVGRRWIERLPYRLAKAIPFPFTQTKSTHTAALVPFAIGRSRCCLQMFHYLERCDCNAIASCFKFRTIPHSNVSHW